MSIIALTIAPLIAGTDDWELAYWGLVPLAAMLIGTFVVYWFFWRNHEGMTQGFTDGTIVATSVKHEESVQEDNDNSYGNSEEDTPLKQLA